MKLSAGSKQQIESFSWRIDAFKKENTHFKIIIFKQV